MTAEQKLWRVQKHAMKGNVHILLQGTAFAQGRAGRFHGATPGQPRAAAKQIAQRIASQYRRRSNERVPLPA